MGRPTTARSEVGLLRVVAQRLAGPPCADAAEAVRLLTAVQAQDLRGALTSVALRTREADLSGVDAALADGRVVRSWPQRGTLHLVAAEDLGWLLATTAPRAVAGTVRRRAELGLDDVLVERARALAVDALSGGHRLPRGALLAHWEAAGIGTDGQRGYHLLLHLGMTGTLCFGPREGAEQLLVLVDEHVSGARRLAGDEALGELALRFFRAHGPATLLDLVRWTGLRAGQARTGLTLARPHLESLHVEGSEHLMDPATPELLGQYRAEAAALHLLPGFDELLLGYADRSAVLAPQHAERICPGRNGVFQPTVVVGGRVVGTWRRAATGVVATWFDGAGRDLDRAVRHRAAALPG